ncbi:hypothetical protein K501DRAFT_329788 [Backusella circina FSU 941]|nr:hypothetical protein K501DRAFT_329788 [Backusella circina FSU 941]
MNRLSNSPNVVLALAAADTTEKNRWSCHKDILKSSSIYFAAIFNNQFQETDASIVFLPRGIFTSSVLDDIIHFLYTESLNSDSSSLEHLQAIYSAADYLGIEKLCTTTHQKLIDATHGLTCYCKSCSVSVPKLLAFVGPQQETRKLSDITLAIIKLLTTQDPEKSLPTFWTSRSLASLLTETIDMQDYLEDLMLSSLTKGNAIETLHGCFLANQVLESSSSWSDCLSYTLLKMRQASCKILAENFDFYCTLYPKLLSCVDGVIYSFDFLEYLLNVVISEEMTSSNASTLYKGIVRSLLCRHAVHHTPRVKVILESSRGKIVSFIKSNLDEIKHIDKNIQESLAQDLGIPKSILEGGKSEKPHIEPKTKKKSYQPLFSNSLKSKLALILSFKKLRYQQEDERAQLKKKSIFESLAKKEAEKENKVQNKLERNVQKFKLSLKAFYGFSVALASFRFLNIKKRHHVQVYQSFQEKIGTRVSML